MKWKQVEVGQVLSVKAHHWKVTARDGDSITMESDQLGERVGSPPPEGEVELVSGTVPQARKERTPEELKRYQDAIEAARPKADKELDALKEYAKSQGIHATRIAAVEGAEEVRELIRAKHDEMVAEDNGVPLRKVQDVRIRLTLGATAIAELHEGSSRPQCPQVEVMDIETLANHLHFFHDTYPAKGAGIGTLTRIHQESHDQDKETELHDHSVPF